ncbi:HAD-IA family hydrolase [Iocasia frigidifontis]|uniref:HAD-IA family hydrolase n=1 Tax=Iocasia fonsfrigidae TaxID=2682810 RepID=A0A8A7KHY9_9FIRM|nr:HAD-IA family hydrolase [Iocasia fonsfrigidae]QTL97744.1 HAD-IA family hydrolase [Iocasia fonsfrigidae]
MLKAVIFDFDGTLFDTNDMIIESFTYAIKKVLGYNILPTEIYNVWGRPLKEQMERFGRNNCQELVNTYRHYYYQISDKLKVFPTGLETIDYLKDQGYYVAILTNKGRGGLINGLEMFNLTDKIDIYLSKDDLNKPKPDIEGFKIIMDSLKLRPEEVLMVGDSPSDIIGGKNAGIKTVLVSYTCFKLKEVMKLNPDYFIDQLNDLIDIVESDQKHCFSL